MAEKVKGITIEFRGNATPLQKAIRAVDSELSKTTKELSAIERALKFNPTNVDLWRQKQEVLTKRIGETEEKLKTLKKGQAQLDAAGVDKSSEQYRKLQREIIESESKLKTFKSQLKEIGNVNLKAASEQVKAIGTNLETAGQKMQGISLAAAGVVAGLGAISYKAGTAADDLNTLSKVTGIGTEELQKYKYAADLVDVSTEDIAKANKKLAKNAYDAANGSEAQAEAFEKLGVNVLDSNGQLKDSEQIFQDVITGLSNVENETERAAIAQELMGKSAANLNPLIEDGGETYKRVSDTLKNYNLDYIDQETLDKANEFNDSIDTMKLLGTVAFAQVGSALASTLAPALEKVVDLVGRFANWLGNLDPRILTIVGSIAAVVAAIAPVLIVLGKVAMGISALINLIGVIGPAIGALSAGPLVLIVAAIAAVIAIGVLLYKNWDKIKETAQKVGAKIKEIWTGVKTSLVNTVNSIKSSFSNAWNQIKSSAESIWNGIKSAASTAWNGIKNVIITPISEAIGKAREIIAAIKDVVGGAWDWIKEKTGNAWDSIKDRIISPFEWASDSIRNIVDWIKGLFPIDLSNFFGNIKLPHFSWDWMEIGEFISIPKISIDWYKKGGIFDSPTIAGIGEAGPEAVVPLDKFWDKLDNIAAASGGEVTINVYASPGMNEEDLARKVEQKLVAWQKQRQMAYGNI